MHKISYKVLFLQQIRTSQTFTRQSIHKSHRILKNLSWPVKKLVYNTWLAFLRRGLAATEQIKMLITVNNKFYILFSLGFC